VDKIIQLNGGILKKGKQVAEFIARAPVISLTTSKQTTLVAAVDSLSNVYLLTRF